MSNYKVILIKYAIQLITYTTKFGWIQKPSYNTYKNKCRKWGLANEIYDDQTKALFKSYRH